MLLLAAQTAPEAHDKLSMGDIGIVLAVIAGCCALILLAGFGYFTFTSGSGGGDGVGSGAGDGTSPN